MSLEKIRNYVGKKSSRVLLSGLLLLSNRALLANSELGDKSESERKETRVLDEKNVREDKNYVASVEEINSLANKENFELARIDFNVNYETDKAELPEAEKEEIVEEFKSFLDNVNRSNFDAVRNANWRVISSCDERPTNAWGEKGNEALAAARGRAVINLLKNYLASFEFSDLDKEQIDFLKNKDISNDIVDIHLDRKGEMLVTDIINPETGKNYTPKEVSVIKQEDPEKYLELLAQNRISQFRADIPTSKLKDIISPEISEPIPSIGSRLEKIEPLNIKSLIKEFPDFKNIVLLFDNSPSMIDNRMSLSRELERNQENLSEVNMMVGHYSDKLQVFRKLENSELGLGLLKDVGAGRDREASVKALIEVLEKIKPEVKDGERTLIMVNTDEALQQLSVNDLEALKDLPDNIEVRFAFYLQRGGAVEVPLSVVQDNFSKLINSKTEVFKKQLTNTEERLKELYRRQIEDADKSDARDLKKKIKNLEKQQESLIAKISDLNDYYAGHSIIMREISDDTGKKINLDLF